MWRVIKLIGKGILLVAAMQYPALRANWRQLLPATGGAVAQIAMDNAGVLYISTNAGLLKSADLGQSWGTISSGLPASSVNAEAVDPNNSGVLYVATTAGVYKSIDGGFSWKQLSLSTTATIQWMQVAPSNSNTIFVATYGDYIYRSQDGGSTWTQQTQGLTSAPNASFMTSIAVDPSNASHVYTSTWRGRLYSSNDGGATWSQLPDSRLWANGQIYISPSNPGVMYTTFDANDFGGTTVLESTNGGVTWAPAGSPGGLLGGASQIAIHPLDPNTVYVSTNVGVYKTISGGASWSLSFAPISGPAASPLNGMQGIALNPTTPSQVFAGSGYLGVFRSIDSGTSWFPFNNGIAGATITGIQICTTNPSIMYAGVQGVGVLSSTDGGTNWATIPSNPTLRGQLLGGVGVDPQNPNILVTSAVAGTDSSTANIWRTSDGGNTLLAVVNGYNSSWFRFNPATAESNVVNASIADYQGGFLQSTNAGSSWSVPDNTYIYPGDYDFHPSLSNVVFSVGNHYNGSPLDDVHVLWSNDAGNTWSQSQVIGDGSWSGALALDQQTPTILYAAGQLESEGSRGIYKFLVTYNGSAVSSITRVPGTFNTGLADTNVRQLLYDQVHGYLYAATSSGVFRSQDQAATWSSISSGLPYTLTEVMSLTPDGSKLIVGTGGGIWMYTDTPPMTPVVTLSPLSLNFGGQPLNTSNQLSVVLSNTGNGPLTITGFNTTSSEFTASSTCPSTLNVGAQCPVNVRFTPTGSSGIRNATLFLVDNALDSPQAVSLTGVAIPSGTPAVTLSASSLLFLNQPLGTTSAAQTITLTNVGNAPLSISRVSVSAAFQYTSSCGSSLAAGSSCSISVTFSPTAAGMNSGQLQIADNAQNVSSPQSVSLSGPSMLDTDGDGIPDDWEANGVTINGVFLDLPAMGANPLKKDLFVQTDWMANTDHSHEPKPEAISKLIVAFANAPVLNPDGTTGINLHIDCGPDCVMNPVSGKTWGPLSQAHTVQHVDPLTGSINELGLLDELGEYDWSSFEAIKSAGLSPTRASVFHYVVFAHDLYGFQCSSGLSRSAPGSDAIVSLGSFNSAICAGSSATTPTDQVGTALQQGGTLMHEIGHNLGLTHGGVDLAQGIQDGVNDKPNFLSVMNYLFQTRGVIRGGLDGNLDFSRVARPPLNEQSLDEFVGLGVNAAGYGTRYYCPGVTPVTGTDTFVANAAGPTDWNCDGKIETNVSASIDGIPNELITLNSYDDWGNLTFTGGSIAQPGAPPPSRKTAVQELTATQDSHITTVRGVAIVGPPNTSVPFFGTATLSFVLTNKGSVYATYALIASATQSWVNLSAIPKQIGLAAGASRSIAVPIQAPASVPASQAVAQISIMATDAANSQIVDSAHTTVAAGSADIAVALASSPNPVVVGNPMTLLLTVSNNGPNAAQSVVVTHTLPPNSNLVSVVASSGSCIGAVFLSCAIGELDPGTNATVSIVVVPNQPGSFNDSANAFSTIFDLNTTNNSSSVTIQVVGKPSLSGRISSQAINGNTMTLSISLVNIGSGSAVGVSVSQIVLRTLGGTGAVTYAGPSLPAKLGNLSQGSSATLAVTLQVPNTVSEFSISERGITYDTAGNIYTFGSAQSVLP